MAADVNTPIAAYDEMAARWRPIEALTRGAAYLRGCGEEFLTQAPRELDKDYERRRKAARLFNAYNRTVRRLVGKPFRRPVALSEDTNPRFVSMQDNVDGAGRTLTAFARDLLDDCVRWGLAHILVEMPDTATLRQQLGRELTVADEAQYGIQPYLCHVDPRALIGWRTATAQGRTMLTQVRLREEEAVPAGPWGERTQRRVRVLYPDRQEVYVQAQDNAWPEAPTTVHPTTLNRIALVTIYGKRTGFLRAVPPLEDLAEYNLRHYESQSAQDTILRVFRCPVYFAQGFNKEELGEFVAGPNNLLRTTKGPQESAFSTVEHDGSAIEAGERDLEHIERIMEALGEELLVRRTAGDQTATEVGVREFESVSDLQSMVRRLEQGLEQAFRLAGEWMRLPNPTVGVDIFSDFGATLRGADDLEYVDRLHKRGKMPTRTALEALKRRGVLPEEADIDSMIAEAQEEFGDWMSDSGGAQ